MLCLLLLYKSLAPQPYESVVPDFADFFFFFSDFPLLVQASG